MAQGPAAQEHCCPHASHACAKPGINDSPNMYSHAQHGEGHNGMHSFHGLGHVYILIGDLSFGAEPCRSQKATVGGTALFSTYDQGSRCRLLHICQSEHSKHELPESICPADISVGRQVQGGISLFLTSFPALIPCPKHSCNPTFLPSNCHLTWSSIHCLST